MTVVRRRHGDRFVTGEALPSERRREPDLGVTHGPTILPAVATSPGPPRHPFLDWPAPIAFAHRGGAGEAENRPAFERAVELGYRFLETDVRTWTRWSLPSTTTTCRGRAGEGRISELPWSEVATARVDGREPIPRLDELLSAWPEIRWNIDCKADRAVDPLALELQRANALPRVCVSAFQRRRLFRLRYRLGSGLCSSAGPAELAATPLPRLDLAGAVGLRCSGAG